MSGTLVQQLRNFAAHAPKWPSAGMPGGAFLRSVADHIERSQLQDNYRRLGLEEAAAERGYRAGWDARESIGGGVLVGSVVYEEVKTKFLGPIKDDISKKSGVELMQPRRYVIPNEPSSGELPPDMPTTEDEIKRMDEQRAPQPGEPGYIDPRAQPHEYVTVENHQGCGVCGYGIGAAVHNTAEIDRRKKSYGDEGIKRMHEAYRNAAHQPSRAVAYVHKVDAAHQRRLSRIAASEFLLIGALPDARYWYDEVEQTYYKEHLFPDHSEWMRGEAVP